MMKSQSVYARSGGGNQDAADLNRHLSRSSLTEWDTDALPAEIGEIFVPIWPLSPGIDVQVSNGL